jgi:hypothetical protein
MQALLRIISPLFVQLCIFMASCNALRCVSLVDRQPNEVRFAHASTQPWGESNFHLGSMVEWISHPDDWGVSTLNFRNSTR